ncbi:uncharacterized protein LOC134671293 isoform X1 [Cydia fagiglandana]|uniref:uncharacterized protein LOC134671293 isoform X1 n=1 Tax=Cydia fagiglandana TaxID=1458189 RepID=UPI002FEE4683
MLSIIFLIVTIGIVLDSADGANPSTKGSIMNDYWCYRAKYCRATHTTVCAREPRLKLATWFTDECTVFNYNCKSKTDYTVTSEKQCTTPTTTMSTTTSTTRGTTRTRKIIKLPTFRF